MTTTLSFSILQTELTQSFVPDLVAILNEALKNAPPLHGVENSVWDILLKAGHQTIQAYIDAHGTGDQGPTLQLPSGETVHKLPELHARDYISIFGRFEIERVVYGSREGQAIECIPLDARLQLPKSAFSYLLQDWDQKLAIEQPFAQVSNAMERMLRLKQHTDSLQNMNRHMAEDVSAFHDALPKPPSAEEGQILVTSADCKGIVIRGLGTPTVCGGERIGGVRANQKRMTGVGVVYTIDPFVRTADEVVAGLFHDANYTPPPRPEPCHKHVWAVLPQGETKPESAIDLIYDWLTGQVALRDPKKVRTLVHLCDGQEALWQACEQYLDERLVQILDLLHVTPRLWAAARLLYGENSPLVAPFVRKRLQQILEGKVETVVRGIRRLMTELGVPKAGRKKLTTICNYLYKNRGRMRYDEYLRKGYPIASGAVEGTCGHLVKDRMERSGMHWTMDGAQAMLNVRSVELSGKWDEFQEFRVERAKEQLYPYWELVSGEAYFATAV